MSTNQHLIEARDVCMRYRVYRSQRTSLRESVFRTVLRRDKLIDVWALKGVSFVVERGESLGIIGANGAGKSTLCLLLSRIMTPTSGDVRVAGKVSALLSLGVGFQADLTGRDNILLNGAFLGYRIDEVQKAFNGIVEFSELGDKIEMPVRTYSSGMKARLAFSIAQSIQPEILIIDELMGVGDARFKVKSTARMREMVADSRALVVVSHNMETIRSLCTRAVWLDRGEVKAVGPADEVVAAYEEHE